MHEPDDDLAPISERPATSTGTASESARRLRKRILAGAAVIAIATGAATVALSARDTGLPDGVAIEVEGERVPFDALERRIEVLEALYGLQPPTTAEDLDRFRRDAAKAVALSLLLDHEVAERGLGVAARVATDALGRYIEDRYPVGGRASFVAALGDRGVSEDDVLAEIRRHLGIRRLFDDVVGEVAVTDADVKAAYEDRRDELLVPEARHLLHLVVATRAEASAARKRVEAGEEFRVVAHEISLDASTRDAGGDLGALRADQLDPSFGEAAFAASPGAVFGPVETDLGWHIGVIESITPARLPSLDEVHDGLRERLVLERSLTRWRAFLSELLATADVEYAQRYRPDDPTAPPPVEVADPLANTTGDSSVRIEASEAGNLP